MEKDILKVTADVLKCVPEDLTADMSFEQMCDWSSLMQLILVSEIERRFGVEIPMEDIPDIRKPEDFLPYICPLEC